VISTRVEKFYDQEFTSQYVHFLKKNYVKDIETTINEIEELINKNSEPKIVILNY
jgi:hypothetical protein